MDTSKMNYTFKYDIPAAKALAKRIFDQYVSPSEGVITQAQTLPMMRDAYQGFLKGFTPTSSDMQGFFGVLDQNKDGRVTLADLEQLCINYLCKDILSSTKVSEPHPISHTSSQVNSLEIIRRVFRQFDTDHSGYIDPSEIKGLLEETYRVMGIPKVITQQDVSDYLRVVDTNGDGRISLEEFESLFFRSSVTPQKTTPTVQNSTTSSSRDVIRRVFYQFDTDKSGYIDPSEIKNLLEETYRVMGIPRRITQQDVSDYLRVVDSNGDGKISLEEFESLFFRSSVPQQSVPKTTAPVSNYTSTSSSSKDVIRRVFYQFDTDRSGFIDPSEIKNLLEETYKVMGIPRKINQQDVNDYLRVVDTNGDGKISLEEFESLFFQHSTPTQTQPVSSKPTPSGLSSSSLEVIRRVFRQFDTDHSGFIDPSEIKGLLEETYRAMGIPRTITSQDVADYLRVVDTNGDGKISLQEFESLFYRSSTPIAPVPSTQSKTISSSTRDVIQRVFRQFDVDHSGFIDPSEIKALLIETYRIMGIPRVITDQDVKDYLRTVDANGDGKISYEEFESLFYSSKVVPLSSTYVSSQTHNPSEYSSRHLQEFKLVKSEVFPVTGSLSSTRDSQYVSRQPLGGNGILKDSTNALNHIQVPHVQIKSSDDKKKVLVFGKRSTDQNSVGPYQLYPQQVYSDKSKY